MSLSKSAQSDPGLLAWSANLKRNIETNPEMYGLSAEQATAYAALHDSFASALALAVNPGTKTKVTVSNKNDARKALVENARLLSNIIYGQGLPDGDLLELGLTVKKQPTPQPAPQQAPDLDFIGVAGSKLRLRVHNNETVSRRRMPEGVTGSWVWSFVGPVPPLDFQQWKWEGSFTRRVVTLDFGMEVEPGMKVWVTAAWINRKGQLGPVASPLEARLPGLVQNAAAQGGDGPSTNETFMKVA